MRVFRKVLLGLASLSLVASCGTLTDGRGVPGVATDRAAPRVATDRAAPRLHLLNSIDECPPRCIAGIFNVAAAQLSIEFVDSATDLARIILVHEGVTFFGGTLHNEPTSVQLGNPFDSSIQVTSKVHDVNGNVLDVQASWQPFPGGGPFGNATVTIGSTQFNNVEGSCVFFPDLCDLPPDS